MRLTTRSIAALKPQPRRREIPDDYLPGHYIVVQPSGVISSTVRYRFKRRSRKFTVGTLPPLTLAAAREAAAAALRAVAAGRDPGSERAQARAADPDTVASVAAAFIEYCRRVNRPRTARATQRLLERYVLPRWRTRMIRDITRRDVLDVLDRVLANGTPIAANRVKAAVTTLLGWCVSRDILDVSPAHGVKRPTVERGRERALSDDEIRRVWQAADELGGPYGVMIKLLILTGQRRDEIAGLRWEEIDLEARLLRLPPSRTKNGKAHDVPLSELACAILAALPQLGPYAVAPTGKAPLQSFGRGKRALDALLPGMPPWRVHDLRRTAATGMARLRVQLPVVERILNHTGQSFSGVAGIYQKHDFADEMRAALDAWARHIESLINPTTANVVEIAARRG